jgi:hypothetical protein
LVQHVPYLKVHPFKKDEWQKYVAFWDLKRKKKLDLNSIKYRLLWIKYFKFFLKINIIPFKRFFFMKTYPDKH